MAPLGKLLLVVAAILAATVVVGVGWIGYRATDPVQMSFDDVSNALVGDQNSALHGVIGWGSMTHGLDDGEDWIEFTTDAPGLRSLLDSRPFMQVPPERKTTGGTWTARAEGWRGHPDVYEDDSEFEKTGTNYYLLVCTEDVPVRAMIARTRQ